MTDEEIKRRLLNREDGWTERKPQSVGGDDVRKALVAFANSLPDGEEYDLSSSTWQSNVLAQKENKKGAVNAFLRRTKGSA